MFDTTETVINFLQAVLPEFSDVASEYGEPGYFAVGETPLVVLGNYWCRCEKLGGETRALHGIDKHYPHAFARLEEQGVELEWLDEWIVDHEHDKAYRTTADSHSWQPSYVLTEDGEILTADDDVEAWIDWAADDATRVIPSRIYDVDDLQEAGFTPYHEDPDTGRAESFESGWYGREDSPADIDAAIRREHGDDVTVVFVLDDTAQFRLNFSAYYR